LAGRDSIAVRIDTCIYLCIDTCVDMFIVYRHICGCAHRCM